MDSVDTSSDPKEPKKDEIMYIYMYICHCTYLYWFSLYMEPQMLDVCIIW